MHPLLDIYHRLHARFGHQHWWPADSPFEVIVGAVLVQNTNWTNVEKALANLKAANLLDPHRLHALGPKGIAPYIRPAGYYNLKARRLHNLLDFIITNFNADLAAMCRIPPADMRTQLLAITGIGPETADCILLYALGHPVFVIDAYTKRILSRHNHLPPDEKYDTYQTYFHRHLPANAPLYNDYHAQLVILAKTHCRTIANCQNCPLADLPCAPFPPPKPANLLGTQKRS